MKHFSVLFLALAAILTGCAHMQPSVTGSSAPWKVRWDIAHMVAYLDAAKDPECKERRSITVEPLPSDKPGTTVERWRVERCGTARYYRITFTPTPAIGGYDYSIRAEDEKPQPNTALEPTPTAP
jgi:hypothetical protein